MDLGNMGVLQVDPGNMGVLSGLSGKPAEIKDGRTDTVYHSITGCCCSDAWRTVSQSACR